MSAFERTSAYGSCTFKPVVREASLWPIGCPEVAVSVSTRPRQGADFRSVALAGQGQLSAKPGNSHCRPAAGTPDRPVPVPRSAEWTGRKGPTTTLMPC